MSKLMLKDDEIEKIIRLYIDQRMSMETISHIVGRSRRIVSKTLKENGIAARSHSEMRSKQYDRSYFDKIDTTNKAYWLGFIYADGYISKKTHDVFSIKINDDDSYMLDFLKNDLSAEHNVGYYVGKNGFNENHHNKYASFAICSDHIVEQLEHLGVYENKTKNCIFPSEDIVPLNLKWDFVRGFFDGDGSVYISNVQNYSRLSISFIGTFSMMSGLKDFLEIECDNDIHIYRYKNKDIYEIKIGNNEIVDMFYKKAYPKNCNRFLNRKFEKFKQFANEQGNIQIKKVS